MKLRYILLSVVLFTFYHVNGQNIDTSMFSLRDSVYVPYIHSIEMHTNKSNKNGNTIIKLNSNDRIIVEFDDSYGTYIDYFYTFYHCTKDWEITPNVERSMYMNGQDEIEIDNFGGSNYTDFDYYHYSFTFPNSDINFLWSGNYIMVVYDRDGTIAFTKKIYIVEKLVDIQVNRVRSIQLDRYQKNQTFEIKLDVGKLSPLNPVQNLYVFGWQNNLNEQGVENLQGEYMVGNTMQFTPQKYMDFPGLKEYRYLDLRSTELGGLGVDFIELTDNETFVYAEPQKFRNLKSNFSDFDLNGSFYLENKNPNARNSKFTSEYPLTTFTLKADNPLPEDVYVVGEFTDYKLNPAFKMKYLEEHKAYILETRLKQGFYDYMFAIANKVKSINFQAIEGSSFETENDYYFLVYERSLQLYYDRIVGFNKLNVANTIGR